MKIDKSFPREPISKQTVLAAVSKVKENSRKKFNESLKSYENYGRRCQWCQKLLSKNTGFCSNFCKQKNEQAVADYEIDRLEKENQRWSR